MNASKRTFARCARSLISANSFFLSDDSARYSSLLRNSSWTFMRSRRACKAGGRKNANPSSDSYWRPTRPLKFKGAPNSSLTSRRIRNSEWSRFFSVLSLVRSREYSGTPRTAKSSVVKPATFSPPYLSAAMTT